MRKTGKIYVWGDSAWDKLGFKETRVDQNEPVEVSDLKIRNVIGMFAGPMQTAFFVSGGRIPISFKYVSKENILNLIKIINIKQFI